MTLAELTKLDLSKENIGSVMDLMERTQKTVKMNEELASDFITANLDQIFDWVGDNKFDDFATFKDNYEEDLEDYINDNKVEIVKQYLNDIKRKSNQAIRV